MLLSVDDLRVSYGKITAVRGLSLTVGEGEIVGLLGPNGAGKSTALRAISGMQPADSGRITLYGHRVDRWSSDRIARLGMSLVPEGRGLFGELTVEENLRMGAFQADAPAVRQRAGTLSGGEQQQLAIARALVSAPRLLVIDEMSLGLAPLVVAELYRKVEEINRAGTSVLLVEQQVALALTIANRAYFLERGAVVMEGPAAQFAGSRTAQTYLGETPASGDGGVTDRASIELVMVPLRGVQTRALQRLAAQRGTNVGMVVAEAIDAYLSVPAGGSE